MNIIAINGSPRKNENTATLLKYALEGAKSQGAQTEIINLSDLNYRGCISCFACKLKNTKYINACAVKDDLTAVLEKSMQSSAIILGSPIYVGDVTGMIRSYLERLIFMNISYDKETRSTFDGKISSAFIYTMNVPDEMANYYSYIYEANARILKVLNGDTEYYLAKDTYQFDDYSKYNASGFDPEHKKKVRETQFPIDCEAAFEIGQKLAKA